MLSQWSYQGEWKEWDMKHDWRWEMCTTQLVRPKGRWEDNIEKVINWVGYAGIDLSGSS